MEKDDLSTPETSEWEDILAGVICRFCAKYLDPAVGYASSCDDCRGEYNQP